MQGDFDARRGAARARPTTTLRELGGLGRERVAPRGVRPAARRPARARRGRRCARTSTTLSAMERRQRAGDDDGDARAGASTRRDGIDEAAGSCAAAAAAAAARRHRHPGHLARRARPQILARHGRRDEARGAGPRRRSRSSRRPTCSRTTAMRCSTSPRCCGVRPRAGEASRARCERGLALYERKGNVAARRGRGRSLGNRVRRQLAMVTKIQLRVIAGADRRAAR